LDHLRLHHNFIEDLVRHVVDFVEATEDHQLQLTHLTDLSPNTNWIESCSLCSPCDLVSPQEGKKRRGTSSDKDRPRTHKRARPEISIYCVSHVLYAILP
jgi:hypothetical protein